MVSWLHIVVVVIELLGYKIAKTGNVNVAIKKMHCRNQYDLVAHLQQIYAVPSNPCMMAALEKLFGMTVSNS